MSETAANEGGAKSAQNAAVSPPPLTQSAAIPSSVTPGKTEAGQPDGPPGQSETLASTPRATAGPTVEELNAKLAQVKAERDNAVAALDKQGHRDRRRAKSRRDLVGVLVVLFSILLPVTYVVTWTHYVALNTNGFVSTVGPAGSDPAVTKAAGAAITNQIFTSLDPQQIVASALPPKASFLAGPITNGVKGFVQNGVTKVLQSRQFQALWTEALRFAHSQLLSIINGNNKAVTTTNGQVVLNLVPLLNAALLKVQGFISGVVGKPVTLPTISGNELPSSVCESIATALHRPVPATCGQIALFPASRLVQARHAVRALNDLMVLLLILTPALAALALWLSRRRRRTLLQLSAGGLIGLLVVGRVVKWLSADLVNSGQPAYKSARQAIMAHLFNSYFGVSLWLLIGLLVVFVVALVTGPYAWARSFRRWVSHYARAGWNLVLAVGGRPHDDATIAWVRSHLVPLQVLGVAVAALLLLIPSLSWVGYLVMAIVLAAYELWLRAIGKSAAASGATTSPEAAPGGRGDGSPPAPSATTPARAA